MEKIITATDGLPISIHVYAVENPKASIQIIHGMSEHKARYDFFAKKLHINPTDNRSSRVSNAGGVSNIQSIVVEVSISLFV